MRKIVLEFLHRGLIGCGFGPIILAIIYLILQKNGVLDTLTVNQVCNGIFSLYTLAFIAGGMNVVYQIERLPLMVAILIHGVVLYFAYLVTYLLNDWLEEGMMPLLVFTVIFVVGYLVIWAIIYAIIKGRTEKLNVLLGRNNKEQRERGQYE